MWLISPKFWKKISPNIAGPLAGLLSLSTASTHIQDVKRCENALRQNGIDCDAAHLGLGMCGSDSVFGIYIGNDRKYPFPRPDECKGVNIWAGGCNENGQPIKNTFRTTLNSIHEIISVGNLLIDEKPIGVCIEIDKKHATEINKQLKSFNENIIYIDTNTKTIIGRNDFFTQYGKSHNYSIKEIECDYEKKSKDEDESEPDHHNFYSAESNKANEKESNTVDQTIDWQGPVVR